MRNGSHRVARFSHVHGYDNAAGSGKLGTDGASDASGGAGHDGDATVQPTSVSRVRHLLVSLDSHRDEATSTLACGYRRAAQEPRVGLGEVQPDRFGGG